MREWAARNWLIISPDRGPSKLHWLMQQKPRSRIIQVMDGSKGPRVIQVLADNNTGHFRAEDKSPCDYDFNKTKYFRLRLYNEVSQQSLKTWDTPETPGSPNWAQEMKIVSLRQLEPPGRTNERTFAFPELLTEPKKKLASHVFLFSHSFFVCVQSVSVIKELCSTYLSQPQLKVFWENWGQNLDLLDCFST